MEHVSSWITPENVFVTIEGDACPVPVVDKGMAQQIMNCSMDTPNPKRTQNVTEVMQWLMSLSDAEVEGGTVFYLDRWTWDTGHPLDIFLGRLLERERDRRKKLKEQIASIRLPTMDSRTNMMLQTLKQLADGINNGE